MFKYLAASAILLTSLTTNAAIITGNSQHNSSTGDVYTYVFTPIGSDIAGTGSGMSFDSNGLLLKVIGSARVLQDGGYDGGLGVHPISGSNPGYDNIAGSEWLTFSLLDGGSFDLMGFTLNNGHQDAATGEFHCGSDRAPLGTCASADLFDGVVDVPDQTFNGTICDYSAFWCDLQFFTLSGGGDSSNSWSGYVESITIRVDGNDVPEPSIIALFGLGLIGLGFARRRRS